MDSSRTSVGRGLGVGIFLLTLATAGIHLYLAFTAIPIMGLNFGVMLFILNGLGYLGLLAVLQLPIPQLARFRSAARWALIAFAAVTIVLFFIMARVHDPWLHRQGDRGSPDRCSSPMLMWRPPSFL